jgi:hypothetical protein
MPAEEKIPRMTSIAPCIFVPLETDITKPKDPPRNRVERLERQLTAVEAQRPGVLENIVYIAERERLAILQEGREREAIAGTTQGPNPSLPPEEVDWIMDRMAAQAPRDKDLSIQDDAHIQQIQAGLAAFANMPVPVTNRERVAKELVQTVQFARGNMEGYSRVVDKTVEDYGHMLERERKRLEDAGKRPEERENAG